MGKYLLIVISEPKAHLLGLHKTAKEHQMESDTNSMQIYGNTCFGPHIQTMSFSPQS